jgi:chlorobactene glucosyltransferase
MFALACVLLAYWLVSLLNILLNLLLIRPLRAVTLTPEPLVSIIVPARDEERAIERTVRAFLAQDYGSFELIVVDDRSTDATGAILERIAAEDSRLIAVHGQELPPGWLGKPWAMHQGSLRAGGELLLFVDADVYYAPSTLRLAAGHNQSTGAAMSSLMPHFESRGLWEQAAMPAVIMTAFLFPLWLGERLSVWWLALGGGSGNLIRRVEYDAVGGHESLRNAVVDDVGLAQLVRRKGHKTEALRSDHLVSVRIYHGGREIVRGFTKNVFSVFGHSLIAGVFALMVFVLFHAGPLVLAVAGNRIAIATVAVIVVLRIIFFRAMRYPFWSAILLHPVQTVMWTWIMLRGMWFVGVRRELMWRGRTYDPADTRFGAER